MVRARERRAAVLEYFSKLGSTQNRGNTFQAHHGLHRPASTENLTLSALVASGAHIGHSKSLMFPTFLPYAYGTRAGITIIDMEQTLPMLRRAANVVRAIARNNGMILFVGTSPSLRPIVAKAAERLGANGFHVGERWIPGTLTNRMGLFGVDVAREKNLRPDCVIFLNPLNNLHAIRECAIEKIPTIGITDSNADPRIVMYAIPGNDESVRTAELIAGVLSLAGEQGIKWQNRIESSLVEIDEQDDLEVTSRDDLGMAEDQFFTDGGAHETPEMAGSSTSHI
ncbi:37S ribosomal protein, mitochondrial [Serendipita sp. 411]|nr:37S ribosomal protein, mitochondrial [Serendipita sp. 400]KAG8856527.1 37S ribosomal protein, mitochondrial [Serendipita sp. 411]